MPNANNNMLSLVTWGVQDSSINVLEIVQLIEITSFSMEHVSRSPDGIMACPGATCLEKAVIAVISCELSL